MSSAETVEHTSSRWVVPAALVIALIAAGLSVWALLRPTGDTAPTTEASPEAFTTEQTEDAKARTCAAFDTVRNAVSIQTNLNLGPDAVAREAVAANARLATLGGGSYLLSRLDPATPPELADSVRNFANNLQDIGIRQLVGVQNTDPAMAPLLKSAQDASPRITSLCK